MDIRIFNDNGTDIAEILSDGIVIKDAQDALDIIANCGYYGTDRIIIYDKNLVADFFYLSNGIAGDILQKFSTYRSRLAIIGDFSKFTSKSLKDFIYESNKTGRISFVTSIKDAIERLR
ncbi:DUF4180 domain-containing protein [Mucilaginibacter sp. AW1-3]